MTVEYAARGVVTKDGNAEASGKWLFSIYLVVSKLTHYNIEMANREFHRPVGRLIASRLAEVPERIQILAGPRQVGKTTLVDQILNRADRPVASRSLLAAEPSPVSVDAGLGWTRPLQVGADWLVAQWTRAEASAKAWDESDHPGAKTTPFVLVIDEVQQLPQWSSLVKGLWDRTLALGVRMHVLLLGSSPVLMQQGLTESLLGRYELLRLGHWSFDEMNIAFGLTLDQYLYFGGFPGSARFIGDETRWRGYVRDSLIAPNIEKDVFEMFRVDKPALLRELFSLGCACSGQIMALDKAKGRLGGHTLTLSHQLTLLSHAGLLSGLHKYAGQLVRQRQSPPKFMVHNTALMSAMGSHGFEEARADRGHWGRVVESAVGAHLINTADGDTRLHYWRDGDDEVDFVVERRGRLVAIEVKSRPDEGRHHGLDEFRRRNPQARTLLVGGDEMPLGEFLRRPATAWV